MRPKKRINRRRGKSVDEYGNKVKVKLNRNGRVKPSSKYSIDKDTMSRMDMVDEAGRLAKDVRARQSDIADKKFRNRAYRKFAKDRRKN
jgi:hypothetical protein